MEFNVELGEVVAQPEGINCPNTAQKKGGLCIAEGKMELCGITSPDSSMLHVRGRYMI